MRSTLFAAIVAVGCCLVGCDSSNALLQKGGADSLSTGQSRATLLHGHRVGMHLTQAAAALKKAAGNTGGPQLQYYGGPVISNVKVVDVNWGSSVNAQVVSYMPGFYTAMVNSTYMDWLSEYNTNITAVGGQPGTNQTIGRGTFGGSVTIAPSNTSTSLQDADIQTELTNQINAGTLPAPDANTIYMINFPPGVSITQGGQGSCSAFCAYHGTFQRNGQDVFYGVMPDFGPGSGCAAGCGTGAMIDNYTSAASHEVIEAVTDSAVGLATGNGPPLAWYDQTNGEIGDICAPGSSSVASAGDGTITGSNGQVYTVQRQWSNAQNSCVISGSGSCTPSCNGAVCGSDGCGGSCGSCASGQTCSNGQCVAGCTPSCNGAACGPDGCGGSCGSCAAGQTCSSGQCVNSCTPNCNGKQCGDDGCGGSCGSCGSGQTCDSTGTCQGGSGGSCGHPICSVGPILNSSCDPCASQICSQDPYCCTTTWDSICVSEVGSICGQSCTSGGGGGGGSTCSHPTCSTGSKLTASCDTCAGEICSQDPYCCQVKWDSQCVSEVGSICGQSC